MSSFFYGAKDGMKLKENEITAQHQVFRRRKRNRFNLVLGLTVGPSFMGIFVSAICGSNSNFFLLDRCNKLLKRKYLCKSWYAMDKIRSTID